MLDTTYFGAPGSDLRIGFGRLDDEPGMIIDIWGEDGHFWIAHQADEQTCARLVESFVNDMASRTRAQLRLCWGDETSLWDVFAIPASDSQTRLVVCVKDQLTNPDCPIYWTRCIARAHLASAFYWAWKDRRPNSSP